MTTSREDQEALEQRCTPLLRDVGVQSPFTLHRLDGGRNNRTYRVASAGAPLLLKVYFSHTNDKRDRLATEFHFSQHVWEGGSKQIPRPMACDPAERLAVYEYVEGQPPGLPIQQPQIDAALRFVRDVNSHNVDASTLADAAESCFCEQQHLHCVAARVRALAIDGEGEVQRAARRIVNERLAPLLEKIAGRLQLGWEAKRIDPLALLTPDERCLSPSDFGFHNALQRPTGELVFLDFEYAGWDDPAKLIVDFFCQVERPAPLDFLPAFAEGVSGLFENSPATLGRVERLLPLYRLKWCCILLNDFLPGGAARREFANSSNTQLEQQLAKAESLVALLDAELV